MKRLVREGDTISIPALVEQLTTKPNRVIVVLKTNYKRVFKLHPIRRNEYGETVWALICLNESESFYIDADTKLALLLDKVLVPGLEIFVFESARDFAAWFAQEDLA